MTPHASYRLYLLSTTALRTVCGWMVGTTR